MPKLCADCRHLRFVQGRALCGHESFLSLVDGQPNSECAYLRSVEVLCGHNATRFEPITLDHSPGQEATSAENSNR